MKKVLIIFMLIFCVSYGDVLSSQEFMDKHKKSINSINTNQLLKILEKNPNIRIIDVRVKKDIINQGGNIKANRVTNIERDKLEFMIANVVKPDEKFIVHCYNGNISFLAVKALQDMGYKNVIHYRDSFRGWKNAKLETRSPDLYPESMLYSRVKKVANRVYTSIGELAPSTYENNGHNNNLGFIVGDEAVLVWNASSTYLLAKAFHEEIKKITNKPVKYIVLENAQSHAALGSNYWKEQGATIIAQEIAKKKISQKMHFMESKAKQRFKDKSLGIKAILPDITFKTKYIIDLGGIIVEARWFGHAHEHSDSALWLPEQKILFTGDLGFYQRLLPIFTITDVDSWLNALKSIEKLKPKIIVPGHGDITDMAHINEYTRDYLSFLQDEINKILDDDGDLGDAYKIDQSQFAHFDAFELLARQNAERLFRIKEFE